MYRCTREDITNLARRIVTNELLVADLEKQEWQVSVAMILEGLDEADVDDVGLILVPYADHASMYWINNVAPGITLKCIPVHVDDVAELEAEVTRLTAALYGEAEVTP